MSIASELYGGDEQALRELYGEHARHGTGWLYVQNQGQGVVSFVGASSQHGVAEHQFRYGSRREHQFVLGEVIIRPHLVIATDALRGTGLSGLATGAHDLRGMLADGEIVMSLDSAVEQLRAAGEL
jgi:hypothetical protein